VRRGAAALGRLGSPVCLSADRLASRHVHRPPGDDFQDPKGTDGAAYIFALPCDDYTNFIISDFLVF